MSLLRSLLGEFASTDEPESSQDEVAPGETASAQDEAEGAPRVGWMWGLLGSVEDEDADVTAEVDVVTEADVEADVQAEADVEGDADVDAQDVPVDVEHVEVAASEAAAYAEISSIVPAPRTGLEPAAEAPVEAAAVEAAAVEATAVEPTAVEPTAVEAAAVPAAPAEADDERGLVLEWLSSFDANRRRSALRELVSRRLDAGLVDAAAAALADPEPDLRLLALQVLERVPEQVPAWAVWDATSDADAAVRARAFALAGRTGTLTLLGGLLDRLLLEADDRAAAAAVDAVATLVRTATRPELAPMVVRMLSAVGTLDAPLERFERELRLLSSAMPAGEITHGLGAHDAVVRRGAAVLASLRPSTSVRGVLQGLSTDEDDTVRLIASRETAREAPAPAAAPGRPDDVVNGLLDALTDPQEQVREGARRSLDRIDRVRVLQALRARLVQASPTALVAATHAAAALDAVEVLDELAGAVLACPDATSRAQAGQHLSRLTGIDATVAELLASADPAQRARGVRLAGLTGRTRGSFVEALRDVSPVVRVAAAEAAEPLADAAVLPVLHELIHEDPASQVRLAALHAVARSGRAQCAKAVLAAAGSSDPEVRRAVVALSEPRDDEQLGVLLELLRDRDDEVARAAARRLGSAPRSESIALLWGALREAPRALRTDLIATLAATDEEALRRLAVHAAGSTDPQERVAAVTVLLHLDPDDAPARVATALGDPSPLVRLDVLDAMSCGAVPAPAPAVLSRLRDPDRQVRISAVRVVGAVLDDASLPELLAVLDDPDERVRDAVVDALVARGSRAVIDLVVAELAVREHRALATRILIALGDAAAPRLLELLPDLQGAVAAAVRDVLTQTESPVDALLAGLDAPSVERRLAALERLEVVRLAATAGAVAGRLQDPDSEVRRRAARLLAVLGDRSVVPALQAAFVSDPDMAVVAEIEVAYRALSQDGGPA